MAGLCLSAIALPSHAATTQLTLNNGDVISGELVSETDTAITLNHAILGEMVIPKATLVADASDTSETLDDGTLSEEPEAVEEDNGLLGLGLLTGWERRLDIGLAGSAGKSDNHQMNVGFKAYYESDSSRVDFKTAYYRAESEGDVSSHTFKSAINRDWLTPDTPWFHFAGAGLDWDEFKDYDYRINGNGGIGYTFIDNDKWQFIGRTGLGAYQTFGGERQEFTPEGLLGVEGRWTISEFQEISASNTLYPNLSTMSEYRNVTTLDWTLDLNTLAGVALKVGLYNEYDASAEDDVDENDFRYTVSLSWLL
jgi:putative salt-induced outer membrane protein YdiY